MGNVAQRVRILKLCTLCDRTVARRLFPRTYKRLFWCKVNDVVDRDLTMPEGRSASSLIGGKKLESIAKVCTVAENLALGLDHA